MHIMFLGQLYIFVDFMLMYLCDWGTSDAYLLLKRPIKIDFFIIKTLLHCVC